MAFISRSFPVTYGVVGSKNLFSASLVTYTKLIQLDSRVCCPVLSFAIIGVRMINA